MLEATQNKGKTCPQYISVVSRHKTESGRVLSDEVVTETELPASSGPQLLEAPECRDSQSRALSGRRHQSVNYSRTITEADGRQGGGNFLSSSSSSSTEVKQETISRTNQGCHEDENRVLEGNPQGGGDLLKPSVSSLLLEEKQEGGEGPEGTSVEDRKDEGEGGRGGAAAASAFPTPQMGGQPADQPPGEGEEQTHQSPREVPGGPRDQDHGPPPQRQSQGSSQAEMDQDDKEKVLRPVQRSLR